MAGLGAHWARQISLARLFYFALANKEYITGEQ
jgi:hypothetical protein